MKNWSLFFDEKGMLTHIGTDRHIAYVDDGTPTGGGDAINREGHFWFPYYLIQELMPMELKRFPARAITIANVIWLNWSAENKFTCRYWKAHPDPQDAQYGTSRDQGLPILLAALVSWTIRGHVMMSTLHSRWGMFPNLQPTKGDWNGDLMFPDHWSSAYRAAHIKGVKAWLIIWIGDIWRTGSILWRIKNSWAKDDKGLRDDVGDSLNLNMEVLLSRFLRPTWLTWIHAQLWGRFVHGGPQWQLDAYFRQPHAPPINELYQPLTKHFFPPPYFKVVPVSEYYKISSQ